MTDDSDDGFDNDIQLPPELHKEEVDPPHPDDNTQPQEDPARETSA